MFDTLDKPNAELTAGESLKIGIMGAVVTTVVTIAVMASVKGANAGVNAAIGKIQERKNNKIIEEINEEE